MDRQEDSAIRFWNNRTIATIPYVPGEQPRDRILVKLNTNENPYAPAPAVTSAIAGTGPDQLRLYPDPNSQSLREAIAGYFGLTHDHVFVGNGSDEVLAMAFQAFFEPTDLGAMTEAITFPDVTYSFYPVYARFYQLNWRTIPVADDFSIPLREFARPSGGIVLANPNAPTGIALSRSDIAWLAEQDRDRLILVDEAYVDFGAETAVPLLETYDNLLIIQTLSKSRALAGLRLGYALGAPGLIEALERIRDAFNSYTVDRLAQAAGIAAFAANDWFETTRARIIHSRGRLEAALTARDFHVLPSAANFVFARHAQRSGHNLYLALRQAGILVRHFSLPRIDDYLRITVGTDQQIDALIRVLDQLLV